MLRKSDFIKWSFWRRTAKRFIPVESTRFELPKPPLGEAARLLNGAKHSKAKCSNFGLKNRRPQNYVGRRPKMGGPDDNTKNTLFGHEPLI